MNKNPDQTIVSTSRRMFGELKHLRAEQLQQDRTRRFVDRLFERLIHGEIDAPHLKNTIRQEIEKPSILNLDTQNLRRFTFQRSIAYRLYGE